MLCSTKRLAAISILTTLFFKKMDAFSFRPRRSFRLQKSLTHPSVQPNVDDAFIPATIPNRHKKKHQIRLSASTSSSSIEGSDSSEGSTSWKERLLKFSNIASFLCVLDCTILPAVTLLLPLLGFVTSAATSELFCTIGHTAALYFVLPVGFLATTTNYLYNHRKFWITSIGWLGMLLIFGANAPHAHGHHHHAAGSLIPTILHNIQHGVWHRVTNLAGCGLLILSNRISHQQQDCCSHGGHDHSHGDHKH